MVLVPYAALSSKTPFPGAAAISSVLGTALLIRYGSTGWVSKLLAWRPFVATGKISYSLYLWHWPVTVFWKYAVYDQLYWFDYVGMFLLSFLFGYLSWKFVELPVRTSQKWTMRRCFTFATTGIVLLVGLGIACVFSKGWPTVLHPQANDWVKDYNSKNPKFMESLIQNKVPWLCTILGHKIMRHDDWYAIGGNFHLGAPKPPEFFIIGDSHAGVLRSGLNTVLLEQNRSAYAITRDGKAMFYLDDQNCKDMLAELRKQPQSTKIIITQCWMAQKKKVPSPQMYEALEKFAVTIKAMGKTLFIATDVPAYTCAPSDTIARSKVILPSRLPVDWDRGLSNEEYDQQQGENNRLIEEICHRTGAVFIPLHLALNKNDNYLVRDEQENNVFYWDEGHLSPDGSLRVAYFLIPYLFSEN